MADVANRGLLVSLGGRSRIRLVSDTEDQGAEEVPAPEMYLLLKVCTKSTAVVSSNV